ncbi:MAG: hypothetical protein KBA91_02040 [Candidatus Moranbacteria bacterium]|nr:hypothetical protein [Candidatus Moranbacteria bacterium]
MWQQMKNRSFIFGVLVFFLIILGFFLVFTKSEKTSKATFSYQDFIKAYPVFAEEPTYSEKKKFQELGQILEPTIMTISSPLDRTYAQYITARAYINAVRKDNTDTASLKKAIDISKVILVEKKDPAISAYTLNLLDMLLYPHMQKSVHDAIMRDAYFESFHDKNTDSTLAFREHLLTYGNSLYRMTDIKMKIALIHAQRLQTVTRKGPEEKDGGILRDQLQKQVLSDMAEAQLSLKQDLLGHGPFGQPSYLPEPLYNKALVADVYFRTTGETPLGGVSSLYQTALDEAERSFPPIKPIIEKSFDNYRASTQK